MDFLKLIHSKAFEGFVDRAMDFVSHYFRVQVENIEAVPADGRAIIAPNHSGYSGVDAVILAHQLHRKTGRVPKILAHRLYFDSFHFLKILAESYGLKRASFEGGTQVLDKDNLLLLFPEGESGNFKSTVERYQLQRFHTGFIRMALKTGAPIVPTVIIGAEESHLNLGNIDLGKWFKGVKVPMPVNLMPLPAKWKIRFLEPFDIRPYQEEAEKDPRVLRRIAAKIRTVLHREIKKDLANRKFIFLPDNFLPEKY